MPEITKKVPGNK